MSELSVGSLSGLAANSYVVDVAAGSTLDLANAKAASLPTSAIGTGGILQVVSTTKTDTFSTSSTSFTDVTGLSASITPRSTSSKILVMVTAQVSDSADYAMQTQLLRDSTAIFVGDASGSTTRASTHTFNDFVANDDLELVNNAFQHLDSPSTTSSVTYKIQLKTSGGTAYVNRTASATDSASRSRVASSITLMEVAG